MNLERDRGQSRLALRLHNPASRRAKSQTVSPLDRAISANTIASDLEGYYLDPGSRRSSKVLARKTSHDKSTAALFTLSLLHSPRSLAPSLITTTISRRPIVFTRRGRRKKESRLFDRGERKREDLRRGVTLRNQRSFSQRKRTNRIEERVRRRKGEKKYSGFKGTLSRQRGREGNFFCRMQCEKNDRATTKFARAAKEIVSNIGERVGC